MLFCRARKPKKHKVLHKESSGRLKTAVYSKMSKRLLWRLSHIFLCFFLIVISNDYLILKNILILQNVFFQWYRAPYKLSDSISLYNSDCSTDQYERFGAMSNIYRGWSCLDLESKFCLQSTQVIWVIFSMQRRKKSFLQHNSVKFCLLDLSKFH